MQHRQNAATTTDHVARPAIAETREPLVQRVFRAVKIVVAGYLALGVIELLIVVGLAVTGHGGAVNSLMWGRSGGVIASGLVSLWFTAAASRGRRWAYLRIRIISIVMPVVIVGLMIIPGVAPLWFKIVQLACAACLALVAFQVNGHRLRRAFA